MRPQLVKGRRKTTVQTPPSVRVTRLSDLRPDPRNANDGTERGKGMLDASLKKNGAGRSILVDRHGVIIAGNKTHERAIEAGVTEVILVPTDGKQLVAVQRTDLDLARDPKAAELGVADNRVGEVSLKWNAEVLDQLAETGVALDDLFAPDELTKVLGRKPEAAADASPQLGGLEYRIVVDCRDERHQTELLQRFEGEQLTCRALIS